MIRINNVYEAITTSTESCRLAHRCVAYTIFFLQSSFMFRKTQRRLYVYAPVPTWFIQPAASSSYFTPRAYPPRERLVRVPSRLMESFARAYPGKNLLWRFSGPPHASLCFLADILLRRMPTLPLHQSSLHFRIYVSCASDQRLTRSNIRLDFMLLFGCGLIRVA